MRKASTVHLLSLLMNVKDSTGSTRLPAQNLPVQIGQLPGRTVPGLQIELRQVAGVGKRERDRSPCADHAPTLPSSSITSDGFPPPAGIR